MPETLFPVVLQPQLIKESEIYDKKYKKSFAWDMEKGDFDADGARKILECGGLAAYQTWCMKTVMTERFGCLAYPTEIGTQMERAMKKKSHKACESAIERTIKEALKVNPRTEYVRGFEFSWDGDSVEVSFAVKGIQYEEFKQSVSINRMSGNGDERSE